MLMPASSEFVALCRAQIALLTQGLGASFSAVYLTEELTDGNANAQLIPIVTYPEAETWREEQMSAFWSARIGTSPSLRLLLPEASATLKQINSSDTGRFEQDAHSHRHTSGGSPSEKLSYPQQIVLPLIHEGVVMGLLVTARPEADWTVSEQAQIEKVARTLAIACVLDQRSQWLDQDLRQQRLLQAQQHDVFDDLLHQFRNPLTALRTFGKLLLRRLASNDANRSVATSIVRESDRLQELLQQFDSAIDMGEANLLPPVDSAPPASWQAQIDDSQAADDIVTDPKLVPLLPGTNFLTGTTLTLEPHLLSEVLEPLLDAAEAIAQDRQLELRSVIPPNLPPVQTDPKALREVLNNLIDNALKYTPSGGKVYVWATSRQGRQSVIVADTGSGIPLADQAHIFERHYRGVQAETDIPGSGLGLAIARDLVKRMQGEIQVFSPVERLFGQAGGDNYPKGETASHRPTSSPSQGGTAFVVWLPEARV
ncbi:GAF domain-containing sensor histidine kinase [Oculatella sp. FACHB-28]|nr:GAF domain-containing sensor histidine kinase [Leptolyngbya sp. FACHB-541]MBD2059397.1 GAF domain-containing sensor histidine kinase [Oculatella sp. FACHB-28]